MAYDRDFPYRPSVPKDYWADRKKKCPFWAEEKRAEEEQEKNKKKLEEIAFTPVGQVLPPLRKIRRKPIEQGEREARE